MFKQTIVPGAGALILALLCGACIYQPEEIELDGQDVKLVFLHTGDIHSRLLPYAMDVGETDSSLGLKAEFGPFGGIARLSAVVRQERRDNERFAYIESGDIFQGAPIFNSFAGEPEFRVLTDMGVDAFAIGNHEFDNGATAMVEKAIEFANFPMLAANYLIEDPQAIGNALTGMIAQPYTILNLKGLKVGVIGMGDLGAMQSIFKGGNKLGIIPLNTRDILQSYVDFLRPQVDLVVVASHLGYHDDLEYIPRVEGIDIVLGGHLHIALNPPNVVQDCDIAKLRRERDKYVCDSDEKLRQERESCESQNGCQLLAAAEAADCRAKCDQEVSAACEQAKISGRYGERLAELDETIAFLERRGCHPRDVLLVHSGAFLKYAGRLEVMVRQCTRLEQRRVCLEIDQTGACSRFADRRCVGRTSGHNDWEVIAHDYKLIPMDSNLRDDPRTLQLLEPYYLELYREQLLNQVIGFTANRLKRFSAGSGDSQVGNMVADAMQVRNQVWADFAVTNSLGIRSDIVSGPVEEEQMTNVFPFENTLTVMYLSGFEVQEMMDFITERSTNRGCQSQAQVAGLTAVLNCGGCPGDGGNPCIRQPYNGEACAQRVTIGGSGRPCSEDTDCQLDEQGQPTGEICTGQVHPLEPGKQRCWLPISCTRSYRLSTNNYIAKGGSGFKVLERNTTQKDLGISMREAAKDYIRAMPACAATPELGGSAGPLLVGAAEKELLQQMERKAVAGEVEAADSDFELLEGQLTARLQSSADLLERKGLTNYLACIDDSCPEAKPDQCTGLAARQARTCSHYANLAYCDGLRPEEAQRCREQRTAKTAKCVSLARIRAALRCLTLPCINAVEDGRLQRIFKESSGTPAPDDPWE